MEEKYFTKNGIKYPYRDVEELCYIIMCVGCEDEKRCHDNCENCDEYYEELDELEKEEGV